MKNVKWFAYLLLAAGTILSSCSNDDSSEKGVNVKFFLTDAPTLQNYEAINIDIKEVKYSVDGETWSNLPITPATYNLLDFTNGKDTLLSNITLLEGERVSQIRLVLGENNEVVFSDGTRTHLDTPSAQQSGLKFNVQENITTSSGYAVMIDFDAARSIVVKGNGNLSLKPVIRAYVVENTSAIEGHVLPADQPVFVFTVANGDTVSAVSDTARNNYFMLHGLSTGTYVVNFQSLKTQTILRSIPVEVFGGTDKDLGNVSMNN